MSVDPEQPEVKPLPLRWGIDGPVIGQALIGEDGLVNGIITSTPHIEKIAVELDDFSIVDPRTFKASPNLGDKLMVNLDQPEGRVEPTNPPANVPNGGIGSEKGSNPREQTLRRFAVEQAVKSLSYGSTHGDFIGDHIVNAAAKIEAFVKNGKNA